MNKFLVIGDYKIGADINYVKKVDNLGVIEIALLYQDKSFVLIGSGSFTDADIAAINAAIVSVWGQGYTDATIEVTLSQAITSITV